MAMKNADGRLENCYYGKRRVIYVTIASVDRRRCKNLSVYGHDWDRVLKAVDAGLTKEFGKTGRKGRRPAPARPGKRSGK